MIPDSVFWTQLTKSFLELRNKKIVQKTSLLLHHEILKSEVKQPSWSSSSNKKITDPEWAK